MFPIVSPEIHRQMFDSMYSIIVANPFVTCEAPPQSPCCCQSLPLFPGNALQTPQPQIRQGLCPSTPNIYSGLRLPSAPQCLPCIGWNPLCQQAQAQLQNQGIFLEQPFRIKLPLNVCSAELTLQVDPGAAGTKTTATTPGRQSQTDRKSAQEKVTATQTKAADGTEATQTQASTQQQQGQNRQNEKIDKASEADFCCLCCDDEADQPEAQDSQTEDGLDGRLVTRSADRQPIDSQPCKQGTCSKKGGQLECEECGCNTQPGGDQQRNEERMREMRRSARERHMKQCCHANKSQPAANNNNREANSNQPSQQNPAPASSTNNPARSAGSTCEVKHLANEIVTNVLSEAAKTVSDRKPAKSILRPGKRKITIRTFEPSTTEDLTDPMQYGKAKELAKGDEETRKGEEENAAKVEAEMETVDEKQQATKYGEANAKQKKDKPEVWEQPEHAEKLESKSKSEVPQKESDLKSKKKKRPPSPEPTTSKKEAQSTTNDLDLKIKRIMQKHEMLARGEEDERAKMAAEKTHRKRRVSLVESFNAEIERQKQARAEAAKSDAKAEEDNRKPEPNEVGRHERRRSSLPASQSSQQSKHDDDAPEPGQPLRTKSEELDATLKRLIEKKEMNAKADEEKKQKLEEEKKNEVKGSPFAKKPSNQKNRTNVPSQVQSPEKKTKADKKTKVPAAKKNKSDEEMKNDGVRAVKSSESQIAGTSGNKPTPVKRKPRKEEPMARSLRMAMTYGFGNSTLATTSAEPKRQPSQTTARK